jgi:hypothetical protein
MQLVALGRSPRIDAAVTALVVLPLVLASAKLGWAEAGPAGGVGAAILCALIAAIAVAPSTPRQ